MPIASHRPDQARSHAVPQELAVFEDWLDIGEPADDLPGRQALVAWSEAHPFAVIAAASLAFWVPVILAFSFG